MHVYVHYRLAGGLTDIYADVETIGMKSLGQS